MNIMKKVWLLLFVLLLAGGTLFAQEDIKWGSNFAQGNTVFGLAGAYEISRQYSADKALAVYPSAEILLWKPVVAGYAPLDFGLMAEGRVALPLSKQDFKAGLGAGGSMHIGFKGFDFPGAEYLDRLDLYARFGVSFDLIKGTGQDGFGTVATSGANYFLDDRLMVGLSYTGWGSGDHGYDGVSLQIQYRLGKNTRVTGMGDGWKAYEETVDALKAMGPVTQFYAFYMYAVYSGGYYWAPESYEEGEGTLWRYTEDGEEPFYLERVLLERNAGGEEWWSLRYFNDEGDEFPFEYMINADQELEILYYLDEDGRVVTYEFDDDRRRVDLEEMEKVSYGELRSLSDGRETVTVPAGTYEDCMVIVSEDDEVSYKWWFSDDSGVNGALVKFVDSTDEVITAELEELISGREGAFKLK